MTISVRALDAAAARAAIPALAELLAETVAGGAQLGFMLPYGPAEAAPFWRAVADDVAAGRAVLFAAEDGAGLVGTVQLRLDMRPNQVHRADIAKMMVAHRARKRGAGAALMRAAEAEARRRGLSLLCLDTVTDSDAERLYARMGFTLAGRIPDYARDPDGGALRPASILFKKLGDA